MNTKRELNLYSFHDHTGIARHLEKMALKGWLLEKTGLFWRYVQCEPKTIHYAVTYFHNAAEAGSAPSDKEVMFRDFCAAAGWEYVTQYKEMQIFRSFRSSPVPLDTEPMVQVQTIHGSMKRVQMNHLFRGLLDALVIVFTLYQYTDFFGVSWLLASSLFLFLLLATTVFLGVTLWELLSYSHWYKRALAAAKAGEFLPTKGRRWLHVLEEGSTWALILCLPLLLFKAYGDKGEEYPDNKYDMGALHYSIYHDEMPLYMEDLADVSGEDYSNRLREGHSPFLRYSQGEIYLRFDRREGNDAPRDLDYTAWSSRFDFPLDLALKEELDGVWSGQHYAPIPAAAGAQAAWQLYDNGTAQEQYLLRYEDHIIEINFGFAPTEEQMGTAIEKLLDS